MKFDISKLEWLRAPEKYAMEDGKITITTMPGTDLWQRTYYHFRNDNAPVLQMETEEKFFSFVVKTDFTGAHHRFDQCIECSQDGQNFTQMRVCHMWEGAGRIRFGVYACSPEDSSFTAVFTDMELTECKWLAHDGQKPDEGCSTNQGQRREFYA